MKIKTSTWFETKVRYEKLMDNGMTKKVTEQYVVDAKSFTEAEEAIIKQMQTYISADFTVAEIKRAAYSQVIFSENNYDDKWYMAKVVLIDINEKTGKEQKANIHYLVNAATFDDARNTINEELSNFMLDSNIDTIRETKIFDVFDHEHTADIHTKEVNLKNHDNIRKIEGCKLAQPITRKCKETFIDQDTKEEVVIERCEVIHDKLTKLSMPIIKHILDLGIKSITIYCNEQLYNSIG